MERTEDESKTHKECLVSCPLYFVSRLEPAHGRHHPHGPPGRFPHHAHGPIRLRMNIQHTGNVFTVTLELAGLQKEAVDISVAEGILTVSGGGFILRERRFGPFKRSIKLPAWVDVDAIKATMAHGVLSLVVEKPEEEGKDAPAKKITML